MLAGSARAPLICVSATLHPAAERSLRRGSILRFPPVGQENTCKPFNAAEVGFSGGPGGFLGAATGTVCVSRDGGTFLFQYSYHNFRPLKGAFDSYFESGTCRFSVHSDTKRVAGPCRGTFLTINAGTPHHGPIKEDGEFFICTDDVLGGQ